MHKLRLYKRRERLIKVHAEGWTFLAGATILLVGSLIFLYFNIESKIPFWLWLPCVVVLLGLSFNFYRFPKRKQQSTDPYAVLGATDGQIVVIEQVYEPEVLKCECIQVSTFMTIFNVHAQWFPVAGEVTYTAHHEGRFMSANLPKSSVENERSSIVIQTENGQHNILVRQIAGAVARRIITYAEVGEQYDTDEPLGFIKFGSRVDLFLPLGSDIKVELGQKVWGNETLIAMLPSLPKAE
ncbi:MAG: phosphatidylserine decarboxylase family protein [Bacteroidales bacterium]|nr:phosphatidylserine decarboxylase family protein [Porphyromonas sp.]MDD7437385.1 phosphatidylserine decarboxylase family protein [Bacteroidales bacterium]MDY3066453.1 phosphatidylserine decarboxylase family protein [Porphyromonas sp.]